MPPWESTSSIHRRPTRSKAALFPGSITYSTTQVITPQPNPLAHHAEPDIPAPVSNRVMTHPPDRRAWGSAPRRPGRAGGSGESHPRRRQNGTEADMTAVFAVDACRTPVGKIKGALSAVRPDHLTADVLSALLARSPWLEPARIADVYWGAANQAGEDNRNVARMGVLLAGLPVEVPGATVNRLCGSSLEAIASAARAIAAGEADIMLAGGTESMTRAPFVLPRSPDPFPREAGVADTRLGWRLGRPPVQGLYPPITPGE